MTTKRLPTYTGMEDGHGNPIHNGDIIKDAHGFLKVVYLQERGGIILVRYKNLCSVTLKPHEPAREYHEHYRDELWILAEEKAQHKTSRGWCGADCPYCNKRSEV